MNLASNNNQFEEYLNKYVNMVVNGSNKKFLVQKSNKFSASTGLGLLDDSSAFSYGIIGESALQCCGNPFSAYCFYICNSNSDLDDDFEIYLNGVSVGSAILGQDDLVGSIFFGDTLFENILDFEITIPFICPLNKMTTYYFNSSLIYDNSTNTLSMINRQENNNYNLGDIELAVFEVNSCADSNITVVTNTELVSSFSYFGDTGVNFAFEFVV